MDTMDRPGAEPLRPTAVQFHRTGDASWRVLDDRYSSGDVRALLGFVEFTQCRYEVTRLGSPMVRTYYSSLDEIRRAWVLDEPGRP
jgi:hypothetical protein